MLIRKSCITGKYTKAHETKDHDLIKIIYMWSLGFNFLSDTKVSLLNIMDVNEVIDTKEIKLQRFKRVKRGSREVPSLSYFKIDIEELEKLKSTENNLNSSKTLAVHYEQLNKLGDGMVEPLAMKILFAEKILDKKNGYENLVTINKIILKAKSIFIHLSTAEEVEMTYTLKFVKEHPFNEFIPDIIQFCTTDVPSVSFY